MTTSWVPYSDVQARPWLLADVERWVSTRVALWARPMWSAALTVLAVMTAVTASPDAVCTTSAPCRAQWLDVAGPMLFLPHLVWLFVLPELALVSTPLLLAWMSSPSVWEGGATEKTADALVVVALLWGGAAVAVRLRVRRRQRLLALDAAGGMTAVAPTPDGYRSWSRGLIRGVVGALASAAAVAVLAGVVLADRADDRTARSATRVTGVVTAYNPDEFLLTVRLPDGSHYRFDTVGAYRLGASEPVLMRGDWVRLASEPYGDRSGRQFLGLALAAIGTTFLASCFLVRRRAAALRRGPVPVLRVLAQRPHGRTEVFAADDRKARRAALHYLPRGSTRSALREALLYGAPREGGGLILASATESGQWITETSVSGVRRGRSGRPAGESADGPQRPSDLAHRDAAEARVRTALTAASAAGSSVRWHAGPPARTVAALWAASGLAAFGTLLAHTERALYAVAWTLGAWYLLNACRRLATWRLTADGTGLRLTSMWWTRDVPWEDALSVEYTSAGELVVVCRPDVDDVRLPGLGLPRLEARFARPSRPALAAAEATAMLRDPTRRPRQSA